jgi:hypothetical protein
MAIPLDLTTLDSALNAFEGGLNVLGYIPGQILNTFGLEKGNLRFNFGLVQTITALGVSILGYAATLMRPNQTEFFTNISVKALEYAAHGALNVIRSRLEKAELTMLLLPYDIYNRKVLSYAHASANSDITTRLFVYIKSHLDKIEIEKILPNLFRSIMSR